MQRIASIPKPFLPKCSAKAARNENRPHASRLDHRFPCNSTLFSTVYLIYALAAPQGPRGGSVVGLLFGTIGFGFMIFAALLGARKRVPTWRLGRAQAWMRGHLW